MRRAEGSGAAEEARGKLAIDIDQGYELLGPRLGSKRNCLVHDEQAEIGDVLPDQIGQWIFRPGHRCQEDRPELAIVQERLWQLAALLVPCVTHGLKSGGSLEQETCFELARTRYFFSHLAVSLGRVLHGLAIPLRTKSTSLYLSRLCTF